VQIAVKNSADDDVKSMRDIVAGRIATPFCLCMSQDHVNINPHVDSVDNFSPFKSQNLIFQLFLVKKNQNYSNQ